GEGVAGGREEWPGRGRRGLREQADRPPGAAALPRPPLPVCSGQILIHDPSGSLTITRGAIPIGTGVTTRSSFPDRSAEPGMASFFLDDARRMRTAWRFAIFGCGFLAIQIVVGILMVVGLGVYLAASGTS